MMIAPVVMPQLLTPGQVNKQVPEIQKFGDMLVQALNKVNEVQVNSNDTAIKFLTGEIQDIHHVTIASEKAKLTMQLAVEVRNKMVEAYQEISRMHV